MWKSRIRIHFSRKWIRGFRSTTKWSGTATLPMTATGKATLYCHWLCTSTNLVLALILYCTNLVLTMTFYVHCTSTSYNDHVLATLYLHWPCTAQTLYLQWPCTCNDLVLKQWLCTGTDLVLEGFVVDLFYDRADHGLLVDPGGQVRSNNRIFNTLTYAKFCFLGFERKRSLYIYNWTSEY